MSSAGASRGVVRGRIRLGHRAGGGCVVCAPAMRLRPADVRDGVRAGGASDAERARHAQGWMVAIGGRARCFDKNNNYSRCVVHRIEKQVIDFFSFRAVPCSVRSVLSP